MIVNKLMDPTDIPKAVLKTAQSFLNRLLGPVADETGELLADKVRYRRFRNQVRVVEDARKLVAEAGLIPKPVALQTLVPLVEKASLEEDPTVQVMWSTLLANAATATPRDGLHRLCVDVLASISPKEALILRYVYAVYERKRPGLLSKLRERNSARTDVYAVSLLFRPTELHDQAVVTKAADGDLLLDNLLRLNIFRWEVPEVEDGQTVHPDFVHLTELGLAVLKECIQRPSTSPAQ